MTVLVGAFGSLIGSFLNVVIFRVPLGRSVLSPPSACDGCGARVRPFDNVPVLSWLLLRGRCRDCRSPISVRYPLVELGTAVAFAIVATRFMPTALDADGTALAGEVVELVAFLGLMALSIALALIDLDVHRLPNALVLPAYPAGAALLVAAAAFGGAWPQLLGAGLGMLVLGGGYLLVAIVRPGGMGLGDVKLAGVLGLFLGWLGWAPLAVGAFAGILLGGLIGLVLLLLGRARTTRIAFGPWLLAGAWVGILAGDAIATGYLSLFGIEG